MRIMLILVTLALVACSGLPARTVEVKVPVPVPCKVERVGIQALPVDALIGTEDVFTIGKALRATIDIQAAHIERLESNVNKCQ